MVPYVGCFYRYTLVKAQRAKYTASLEMRRSYCAENIAIFEGSLSDRPFNGIASRLFLEIEDRSEKGHGARYIYTMLVLRCAALAAQRISRLSPTRNL